MNSNPDDNLKRRNKKNEEAGSNQITRRQLFAKSALAGGSLVGGSLLGGSVLGGSNALAADQALQAYTQAMRLGGRRSQQK
jgi:hypothetical protein